MANPKLYGHWIRRLSRGKRNRTAAAVLKLNSTARSLFGCIPFISIQLWGLSFSMAQKLSDGIASTPPAHTHTHTFQTATRGFFRRNTGQPSSTGLQPLDGQGWFHLNRRARHRGGGNSLRKFTLIKTLLFVRLLLLLCTAMWITISCRYMYRPRGFGSVSREEETRKQRRVRKLACDGENWWLWIGTEFVTYCWSWCCSSSCSSSSRPLSLFIHDIQRFGTKLLVMLRQPETTEQDGREWRFQFMVEWEIAAKFSSSLPDSNLPSDLNCDFLVLLLLLLLRKWACKFEPIQNGCPEVAVYLHPEYRESWNEKWGYNLKRNSNQSWNYKFFAPSSVFLHLCNFLCTATQSRGISSSRMSIDNI